ncbi:unnamed protein product [Boreogadus saida]
MDDERLVVEVEKYVELYDQSSRHYKDNSKKVMAWRAIALEIGSSGDFLHLYCSAAVAPPPVGARGVLLTRYPDNMSHSIVFLRRVDEARSSLRLNAGQLC